MNALHKILAAAEHVVAQILLVAGNRAGAITILERLRRRVGDEVGLLGTLGLVYGEAEMWADAANAFELAVGLDQQNAALQDAALRYDLGRCYQALGRVADAIEAYQEAVRIQPTMANAHFNLGLALVGALRYDEASAAFEAAARLTGNDPEITYNLALSYIDSNRVEAARQLHAQLMRTDAVLAAKLRYRLDVGDASAAGHPEPDDV